MGKTNKRSKVKKAIPFVSVCTPTFNRRPFINAMIKCFNHQDYPKENMEWIIIDDGTDPVGDLVAHLPCVKYFKYDTKMSLGRKRNIMHEKSKGEIIVYMDDDDYYPPQRVSHAVEMLVTHPSALCAGSSEIYIYFQHLKQVYQFGPYTPNHATAGTFAFKRKLLDDHAYNNDAALAEEKAFLKNYSVPFVQLDPKKVILVFSHEHNTFDKRKLLDDRNNFVKLSDKTVGDFVKESDLKQFYMFDIHEAIKDYPSGMPEMKPDVIKQTKEIELQREKDSQDNGKIFMQDPQGNNKQLSTPEVVEIIKNLQKENLQLKTHMQGQQAPGQAMQGQQQQGQQPMQGQQQQAPGQAMQGQIIMETPNGEKKALSTDEIAHLIRTLQQENIALKQPGMSQPSEHQPSEHQSSQFIFTNEYDEMDIIDSADINDYVYDMVIKLKAALEPKALEPKVPEPKVPDPVPCNDDSLQLIKDELAQHGDSLKLLIDLVQKGADANANANVEDKFTLCLDKAGVPTKMTPEETYNVIGMQQEQIANLCDKIGHLEKNVINA